MLAAWSSVLIRWAYTVNVVLTSRWPMSSAMPMGRIRLRDTQTRIGVAQAMETLTSMAGRHQRAGVYMPRAPRVDPPPSGVGRPRRHKPPRGQARGYPGDPVAR